MSVVKKRTSSFAITPTELLHHPRLRCLSNWAGINLPGGASLLQATQLPSVERRLISCISWGHRFDFRLNHRAWSQLKLTHRVCCRCVNERGVRAPNSNNVVSCKVIVVQPACITRWLYQPSFVRSISVHASSTVGRIKSQCSPTSRDFHGRT